MADEHVKTIASNRKARHLYHVESTVEAGISLRGTEVKSLRQGHVTFQDAYADLKDGEVILRNLHINPYSHASVEQHDPMRPRRLLLHHCEINKLAVRVLERGYTLIPMELYFKSGKVKVKLGLCRGKKKYDQREAMKEREHQRAIDTALRERERGR